MKSAMSPKKAPDHFRSRLSSSKVRRARCDVARASFLSSISKAATREAYAH